MTIKQRIKEYLFGKTTTEAYYFELDKNGNGVGNYDASGLFQKIINFLILALVGDCPVICNVKFTLTENKGRNEIRFQLTDGLVSKSHFKYKTKSVKMLVSNTNKDED